MMFSPVQNIVACLWLVAIGFWIIRAFGNKRTVRRQRLRRPLLLAALSVVIFIWLINSFRDVLARPFVPDTPVATYSGLALVIAGIALAVRARLAIGRNWSGHVTIKEDHVLIKRGPYAYVRHPIYTGLLLAMLGTAIVFRETYGLIIAISMFATLVLKSRIEEKFMIDQFGDEYREYRKRVKGFVPFVW